MYIYVYIYIYTYKQIHTQVRSRGEGQPGRRLDHAHPGARPGSAALPGFQPAEGTPSPSCLPAVDPSGDSRQDVRLLLPTLTRRPGRPHREREHRAGRRRGTRPDRQSQGRTGGKGKGEEQRGGKGRKGSRAHWGPSRPRHSPAPHPGSAIAPRPEAPRAQRRQDGGRRRP